MSWEKIFEMKILPSKEKTCSACDKKKTNTCETIKDATQCKELKKDKDASTDKTS